MSLGKRKLCDVWMSSCVLCMPQGTFVCFKLPVQASCNKPSSLKQLQKPDCVRAPAPRSRSDPNTRWLRCRP